MLGVDRLAEDVASWRSVIQWDLSLSETLEKFRMQEVNVRCTEEHQATSKENSIDEQAFSQQDTAGSVVLRNPEEGCQGQERILENLEIAEQEMSQEKVGESLEALPSVNERYLVDLT